MADKCQVCLGRKGGVRGNENVIDGVVLCDYCLCELKRRAQGIHELLRLVSLEEEE